MIITCRFYNAEKTCLYQMWFDTDDAPGITVELAGKLAYASWCKDYVADSENTHNPRYFSYSYIAGMNLPYNWYTNYFGLDE